MNFLLALVAILAYGAVAFAAGSAIGRVIRAGRGPEGGDDDD